MLGQTDNKNLFPAMQTTFVHSQLEDLVDEHTHDYDSITLKIKGLLDEVQDALRCLSPRAPSLASGFGEILSETSSIRIPSLPLPPLGDTQLRFAFEPPTQMTLIGSFPLQSGIRDSQADLVDLSITMPGHLLENKDFLDYRYFRKRAFYLACLAQGLQDSLGKSIELAYARQDNDDLRPCILIARSITDSQVHKHRYWVRIIVLPGSDVFDPERLQPWRSCVRARYNKGGLASHTGQNATPFYNSAILAECLATHYQRFLENTTNEAPGFRDACILTRVWLRQRGFASELESGGFGGFESACCLALCLKSGARKPFLSVSHHSNALQLFVSLLQLLAHYDAVKKPIVFGKNSEAIRESTLNVPVLYDAQTQHNLLFKMSSSSYCSLKSEAKICIDALARSGGLKFDSFFISKTRDAYLKYDHVLEGSFSCTSLHILERLNTFHSLLATALSDRVYLIDIRLQPSAIKQWWSCSNQPPLHHRSHRVLVGLKVNPTALVRRIDLGPLMEERDRARDFRMFWGEKTELRRFANGEIRESVTWPEALDETDIVDRINSHVVKRHLQSDELILSDCLGKSFTSLLGRYNMDMPASESFRRAELAFKTLQACLWRVSGNPLKLRKISASGAGLRYASVRAGQQTDLPTGCQQLDVIIQFEGSVRWPEDIVAIQHTKAALLPKVENLLTEGREITSARLGLENEGLPLLNQCYLEVISQGFTFRLRVYHNYEAILLEKRIKDRTVSLRDREHTVRALFAHGQSFVHAVRHTEAVRELCVTMPLLSPAIRLTKLWMSSHILSSHFSEEVLELITTFVFTSSYPNDQPGSLRCAFLRVLSLVAKWDWQSEPLIVPLSTIMIPDSDVENIIQKFHHWRKTDPAMHRMSLFVASSLDHDGTTWTSPRPSIVAINRFVSLCNAALITVVGANLHITPQPLFVRSLAEYDFVIKLHTAESNRKYHSSPAESDIASESVTSAFIIELERVFSGYVCFFHDHGSQAVIGGLWIPRNTGQKWTVGSSWATKPATPENREPRVTLNREGMLSQMAALGVDVISQIVTKEGK